MHPQTPPAIALFHGPSPLAGSPLRRAITDACRLPEPNAVQRALQAATLDAPVATRVQALALRLGQQLRNRKAGPGRAGLVQNLLQEYALSSQEGIALMCLAEALLRIPDNATRDALIRDKISQGQWENHLGRSPSLFVNAATWGLLLTGKLTSTHSEAGLAAAMGRMLGAGGEPLIRKGVDMAMRMMGEQFVTGETIDLALRHAVAREREGFRYSFDMLGEAALTAADAKRYASDYEKAIHAIGRASGDRGIFEGPGISIKLSALHPRYSRAQYDRVMDELYPTLLHLCGLARQYNIGLNIDAEEADRLELSLDLLEKLALDPELRGWNGLGFVIQAYQKRCPWVIDWLIDLARRSGRRLMVRLVKGAYWDSEIKRAQIDGLKDYPVYTRKAHTDVAYIACARRLLAAPDAIYPQFATHNAQTLATIFEIADPASYTPHQYEFQCLHGMGEPLYEQVVGEVSQGKLGRPCRIYAPVGTHETLLAYLVRRLLENGANTSFVNQVADPALALDDLVRDPVESIHALTAAEFTIGQPHPAIPLPGQIYGPGRENSRGLDLSSETQLGELAVVLAEFATRHWTAQPMLAHPTEPRRPEPVTNPAQQSDVVGEVCNSTLQDVELALQAATASASAWAARKAADRAAMLQAAADTLQGRLPQLISLLMREAGKTAANAVAEVREAVDFLRYYAAQACTDLNPVPHTPLGPVVCISPWNFPLAIFMGQVSAALAAGNVVLAKPAEQTPLIAAEAVRCLWAAGVPHDAVQLLPGEGAVIGAALVQDPRIQGVLFTGSTEVARHLQAGTAGRVHGAGGAIPLIAETGGQNAMIVDSSALAEQVVADVLASAFDSAGQRCSALRVLCVQDDVADRVLAMLLGAMAELRVGDPARLCTDVGPVIDEQARGAIESHIETLQSKGRKVHCWAGRGEALPDTGTFVVPTVIEIEGLGDLQREVFGPVLHFVRYRREALDELLAAINATGYGLTMGLHTRIDETIDRVAAASRAGNLYVNRNMVGAVVGVQPFGGEGLSGTGPKAGGPLYLYRLLAKRPGGALARAMGSAADNPERASVRTPALAALQAWAGSQHHSALGNACQRFAAQAPATTQVELPGPTGERNVYALQARRHVLCLAADPADLLLQLAAVLAVGGQAVWEQARRSLLEGLPEAVREQVVLVSDPFDPAVPLDAVLLHGSLEHLGAVQQQLLLRKGAVLGVERMAPGSDAIALERLVSEHTLSVNTAAAGGNASLMTIG